MAKGEPPFPPPQQTWAGVVRDGQPATAHLPSSKQYNPSHATILQQMFDTCVARGIAAKLEFETVDGAVENRLICSATASVNRKQGRKRPDNERRRQRREAWRMKTKTPTAAATTGSAAAAGEAGGASAARAAVRAVPRSTARSAAAVTAAATVTAVAAVKTAARPTAAAEATAAATPPATAATAVQPPPTKRPKPNTRATAKCRGDHSDAPDVPVISMGSPENSRSQGGTSANDSLSIEDLDLLQRQDEYEGGLGEEKEPKEEEEKEGEPEEEEAEPDEEEDEKLICKFCNSGYHGPRINMCSECFEINVSVPENRWKIEFYGNLALKNTL